MPDDQQPVTESVMQAWQAEVRDNWREHRKTHERIEEKLDGNTERIVRLEGKFDNGIHMEIQRMNEAHGETRKMLWKIVWYVLGGMAGLGGVAALITSLVTS